VSSAGVRALIVEDDQSWQQILTEILTDTGLTVDVAENLETAVARLRATHYRLAVVDLALDRSDHHNQDGLRVLDAARRDNPGCEPVLLTGFATPEIIESALTQHHAFACLRKEDFRRTEFRDLVNEVLANSQAP
jgi:ActR/RegA family two-component response regulator